MSERKSRVYTHTHTHATLSAELGYRKTSREAGGERWVRYLERNARQKPQSCVAGHWLPFLEKCCHFQGLLLTVSRYMN